MKSFNQYNQEIGFPIEIWEPRQFPEKINIEGEHCRLEPLDCDKHALQLSKAYAKFGDDSFWTYLPIGPFSSFEEYKSHVAQISQSTTAVHYAIVSKETGSAVGFFNLQRIDQQNGIAEVGFVVFSPDLQRTIMSTEAHYLLMRYFFETLKYRRLEWRCDTLNEPSRRAALRLGYTHEGTFRQSSVVKSRNHSHHWFSVIDGEWDSCSEAFEQWLSKENFKNGKQIEGLAQIRNARLESLQ